MHLATPVTPGYEIQASTVTVNAIVAVFGKDERSENESRMIGKVFEVIICHLDEMTKIIGCFITSVIFIACLMEQILEVTENEQCDLRRF